MKAFVISAGRPERVEPMMDLLSDFEQVVWIVPDAQRSEYQLAKRENGEYVLRTDDYVVSERGGLVPARNLALDLAFASDENCIQLSDDLKGLNRLVTEGSNEKAPLTLTEAVRDMVSVLECNPARLAGVAPTNNPFFGRMKVMRQHFIVGDLIVVEPTDLRFDPFFSLKEDYDYTCQHIEEYGEVARCDWILADFAHRSNKGGAVDRRTPELEQKMIAELKRRWPGWIVDNPRRENEVLLKASKPRRVVWS